MKYLIHSRQLFFLLFLSCSFLSVAQAQLKASPLHIAAKNGNINQIILLLHGKANIEKKDSLGLTPLFYAISGNQFKVVEHLIKKGANVNARTNENYTPLYTAALQGSREILILLLNNGAVAGIADNQGNTPLSIANAFNRDEIAHILVSYGERPKEEAFTDTYDDLPELHRYAHIGDIDKVKWLLASAHP